MRTHTDARTQPRTLRKWNVGTAVTRAAEAKSGSSSMSTYAPTTESKQKREKYIKKRGGI